MKLIDEIEISYFRSFYKFKLRNLKDLNVIFGKNDSGKSNIVRALNLFFSGAPEIEQPFDFLVDFCEQRSKEAEDSEDVRKFLYVKITFNTPQSYQPSLGKKFYVKRQWTISRGQDYHEEISNNIPSNRRHIARRLINKISFFYVPAIKDIRIFEMLLSSIHETIATAPPFEAAVEDFSKHLQDLTREMFDNLPREVATNTKIAAPTRLSQLFQTLDFETIANEEERPKSLTRQRGDGIKVRHIPELLSFISEKDKFDFHIWGFEEPENCLDFVAAESEARRMLTISKTDGVQIFMTTHSPSFYLLDDHSVSKYYVGKSEKGLSTPVQGRELDNFDAEQAIGEGFYLPAVAEAVKTVTALQNRVTSAESRISELKEELQAISAPVVLTEGRTDAKILQIAWSKRRGDEPPFSIRSCETGGENAGSGNGGAQRLAIRLKGVAADHPHPVIGLFDYDEEGLKAYKLDKNFVEETVDEFKFKRGMHGQSYAIRLPAPEFRQDCMTYSNLPTEFLFRDEYLIEEVDDKKLILAPKKASTKVGSTTIQIPLENVTHFKDIVGGKTDFSHTVVPTFSPEAFDGFDAVFNLIEQVIDFDQNRK